MFTIHTSVKIVTTRISHIIIPTINNYYLLWVYTRHAVKTVMFCTDYDEDTSNKAVKDQASAQVPCGDFRPGEDDLQIIDFIRKFGLDSAEEIYKKSVTKVTGSNRFQTAYRVEKTARLLMPTRYM